MKNIGTMTLSLVLTITAMTCRTALGASIGETLQQGLYAEEVEGNINAAIQTYGQVIKSRNAPPNLMAQALYRQGMCYLKIKDEQSARAVLEKLVTEYPGQTEIVEKARPVLDDLTNFDPATLMPPGTLMYVEFGSPGTQIETILNMLKGTPYENPLAAIGGQQATDAGQKSPGDIMAALLNPSMMAEFKKIRGSAIGVTACANNNPPMVAVLYPGKSDALRGLILAGLGVVGTPGEPIEGMQSVTIKPAGAAAYDDKVIIFAQPASQLQWCVKQYKGLSSEPTLASSNKSFAKLGKSQRHKNALTIWANVDESYAQLLKLFPPGQIPPGILSANAIADFSNIDEVVLTESVEPNSLGSRTEIQFKDGHHCLVYDMIRTPNIGKAALEAVPAEAIAVASFALNHTDSAQADKVRAKIQDVTGLDVGREIFANLEQVTVFALPAEGNFAGAGSPNIIAGRLGLAITSRNPEQTQQVLGTLLRMATARTAGNKDARPGQYIISANGKQDLVCHLEQVNGITLLSLNRQVINASVAAIKSRKSVCASGPLNGAVNRLAPTASKLLLVNAGGAMRLLRSQMNFGTLNEEQAARLNASLEQLARAADLTTVELGTDEQPNTFAVNSAMIGIPPLNQILGPATQIAQIRKEGRAQAAEEQIQTESPATILPTATMPVIDGKADDLWSGAKSYKIAKVTYEPPTSASDLSAEYKALWDQKNLYLLVNVTDDILISDSGDSGWLDDSVEVFIDADNSKSNQYDDDDGQYLFTWNNGSPKMSRNRPGRTENIEYSMVKTKNGYCLETKFPWATLGKKPCAGSTIGLEVKVNDDDDGGDRDSKISWHDGSDNAWQNPQLFGNAELAGLVGWWKLDEAAGSVATDSSGNGHNGALQGNPVWRPQGGRLGGAIELGGHGDYVEIENDFAFNITGQITIAAWVNIKSVPQEWTGIVTKGDSAWRMSSEYAQNAFHFGLSRQDYLNGRNRVSPGQWHHVVCTYNGQKMSTYVDGRLDASRPRNGPIGTNDFAVCIGENIELPGHCWLGLIDDVRIYNYALSESQIQSLANGQ